MLRPRGLLQLLHWSAIQSEAFIRTAVGDAMTGVDGLGIAAMYYIVTVAALQTRKIVEIRSQFNLGKAGQVIDYSKDLGFL